MLSQHSTHTVRLVAVALLLGACSSTVVRPDPAQDASAPQDTTTPQDTSTPLPDTATSPDVTPAADAQPVATCACPSGRCAVNTTWRAEDGCNTCICMRQDVVGCTTIGCFDAGPADVQPSRDAGPRTCRSNADCGASEVCEYEPGCANTAGRCVSNGCQSLPVAPIYCGCDGRNIQAVSACRPDRPYVGMGMCTAPVDAGPGRRHPDAAMIWQSPGGFAGWGPALMVTGDGTIRLWRMRSGFTLDATMPPADRTVTVSGAEVDQLFDLWSMVNTRALPHMARGGDCYPSVSARLCRTCAETSVRYTTPASVLPEMEAVWTWFDRHLAGDSPRGYCAF